MPFASAVSTLPHSAPAATEAAQAVRAALGGSPDLAIAFYSSHHAADAEELGKALAETLQTPALVAVLGEAVIGGDREYENRAAISVWGAKWGPGVEVDVFHLDLDETPDGPSLFGWPDAVFDSDLSKALMLCFGDPYSFPAVELFLPTVNDDHPGLTVAGGMASNPTGPGASSLILNGEVMQQGAVGVLIRGASFRAVVSQGCRPIGKPLVITKGQDNVISELGGRTPLEYLRGLLEEVSPTEKALMERGLLIGMAISEYRDEFKRGDFLVRNLIGLDPRTGAVAVTDRVRRGQTIQFQVRDAETAGEDLKHLLDESREHIRPHGGLIFSCNGRGTRLFGEPDHDAKLLQETVGSIPLAGFFAAGEIGMVGGKNFIHGFTASVVLFD